MVTVSRIVSDFEATGILLRTIGPDVSVRRAAPADDCGPGDLVFVDKKDYLGPAVERRASAAVVDQKLEKLLPSSSETTFLISPNVRLAQARILQKYFDRDVRGRDHIHPSAVIDQSAQIAGSATIGPGVVIGARVRIGDRCVLMANVVVEEDAVIGDDTVLHPSVVVGARCELGRKVIVRAGTIIGSEGFGFAQDAERHNHRIPHLGRVVIEDRVVLGANCCIDRGTYQETRIGAGSILDNLCHVAHNVVVGRDCILTAMFCVAGSTKIGDRVMTSGQTGMIDHLEIASDTVFLHRAGVTQDVRDPGVYAGTPLQPMADYLKNTAAARQGAELRSRVRELEKKVLELHPPEK